MPPAALYDIYYAPYALPTVLRHARRASAPFRHIMLPRAAVTRARYRLMMLLDDGARLLIVPLDAMMMPPFRRRLIDLPFDSDDMTIFAYFMPCAIKRHDIMRIFHYYHCRHIYTFTLLHDDYALSALALCRYVLPCHYSRRAREESMRLSPLRHISKSARRHASPSFIAYKRRFFRAL